MSNNFEIFKRNAEKADKLQAEHGLFQSYRDLYAWEELTEDEVVGLQKYWNATHPQYTGIEEIDSKLMEGFEKEYASWDLDESKLTDPKAKDLYESCCLDIDEALELQRIRTQILKDKSK